jgi:uncharacterized membrane protein YdbT with pleckstrin-like domain
MNDSKPRLVIMTPNTSINERVILDTPPHILFLILPILATVVLWFLYVFLICPLLISALIDGRCILISGLSFFLLITIIFLDWTNNRLILTNLRVTRQRGVIGKTIMEIGLGQVQDIKISFSILGRIFDFGTLEIESAGTFGKIIFRGIPELKKVKNHVETEIKNLQRNKSTNFPSAKI